MIYTKLHFMSDKPMKQKSGLLLQTMFGCGQWLISAEYMDTDVEVKKFLDGFLKHRAFSGFEDEANIPTGIMACEKNFPLFGEFLNYYDDASFYDSNGNITYVTNVKIITDICVKKGLLRNNTLQNIEGFVLYSKDVFCPVSYHTLKLERTKETVTIHWFAGSWKLKLKETHTRIIPMK